MPNEKVLSLPPSTGFTTKVTNSDLYPSNRTNRQITVYFKRYVCNEYPLNDGYLCPETG